MAYRLDLSASKRQALQGVHDVFHVNLLRCYRNNSLDHEAPPTKVDGEEQYKVQAFWKYCAVCGDTYYLVKWVRYNELESLWLTTNQLDLAQEILKAYKSQNWISSATSIR